VLDETNDQIYIFFQENTWAPYGAIYMKVADAYNPIFNPDNLGQQIITGTDGSSFIDPQRPPIMWATSPTITSCSSPKARPTTRFGTTIFNWEPIIWSPDQSRPKDGQINQFTPL
jgi:hypothetical protein